jgi:LAS superfamily LD-carboxypeptidase LdcB
MNNNSRKAKSRYLQNIVKDKIINLFKLNPADIRTSNTGENGEDIKLLSITSKRVFPYSVECTNTEQYIGLYRKFKQAERHNHRQPLLVVKKKQISPACNYYIRPFF